MRLRLLLILFGFGLLGGCRPALTVDAPEINVTQRNVVFPGVVTTTSGPQTVNASFEVTTTKLGAAANPDSSALDRIERMEITRIVLQARSGITDFGFLDHLKVSATNWDPNKKSSAGKPVLAIMECPVDDRDCPLLYEQVVPTLSFPLEPPVDLTPLWVRTFLYLIITAEGILPNVDWSIDVTFSLSVRWST